MKYRKKPIEVEAWQWFKNGDHPLDDCFRPFEDSGELLDKPREGKLVRYFCVPNGSDIFCPECNLIYNHHGFIDTLEGGHRVCPGDWIIQGIQGEFYPCKPDIFEKTYERVEE